MAVTAPGWRSIRHSRVVAAVAVVAGLGVMSCGSVPPSPAPSRAGPAATQGSATTVSADSSVSGSADSSGSGSAEDAPLPIEVVETGFVGYPDEPTGFASYGAVLHNPNTGWAVLRAEVHVDFLDAGGTFVGGEEVVVTILPGQTTAIGGQSSGAASASRMEVHPPEEDVAFVQRSQAGEGFETELVRTDRAGGQTVTTGRLISRFATVQSFVQLVAIQRDAAGAIVGGEGGGVQSIAPGATVDFEIVDGTPYAGPISPTVYWQVTR